MNIVFFGSDNFAVLPLQAILRSRHKVLSVVTQPDKQKGRRLATASTAVKVAAVSAGLKVYQPADINSAEALAFLKSLKADLFVVAAYGQILSQEVLALPREFSINAHASLLPKYRGASPISRAIICGERVSGVTIIKLAPELDAGPVILSKKTEISAEDTSLTLEDKLSPLAADLLLEAIEIIESQNYKLTPQDQSKTTLAPKLKKSDGLIKWDRPAQEIHNLIRGCLGWPGAFTYYRGRLLKIYNAHTAGRAPGQKSAVSAGQVLEAAKTGIKVAAGVDALVVDELQIEGRKRMSAADFLVGNKISVGEILGTAEK